jgi:mono/diheme cytochrome c family protein
MVAQVRRMTSILVWFLIVSACAGAEVSNGDQVTTTVPQTTIPPMTISEDQLAQAHSVGDVAAGEALYYEQLEWISHDLSCADCHSLDGIDRRSPSLRGISQVAEERVEGLSDVDYMRQSITDPAAYLAGDWPVRMPFEYGEMLTEEQVDDLVAFLLTQ